jgi:hypothetical protein
VRWLKKAWKYAATRAAVPPALVAPLAAPFCRLLVRGVLAYL